MREKDSANVLKGGNVTDAQGCAWISQGFGPGRPLRAADALPRRRSAFSISRADEAPRPRRAPGATPRPLRPPVRPTQGPAHLGRIPRLRAWTPKRPDLGTGADTDPARRPRGDSGPTDARRAGAGTGATSHTAHRPHRMPRGARGKRFGSRVAPRVLPRHRASQGAAESILSASAARGAKVVCGGAVSTPQATPWRAGGHPLPLPGGAPSRLAPKYPRNGIQDESLEGPAWGLSNPWEAAKRRVTSANLVGAQSLGRDVDSGPRSLLRGHRMAVEAR